LRGNVSREEWNSFIVWIGTESSAWIRLEFCVAVCFLIMEMVIFILKELKNIKFGN
jgi:hypothetical protein